MIGLLTDIALYILLLAAIGFGWISLIGLLLFPDLYSRMFTGVRAGLIAMGFVTAAGIVFGLYKWNETGGATQYPVYIGAAILLLVLLLILNWFSARALGKKAGAVPTAVAKEPAGSSPAPENKKES
ncbi:MAG: hypothetical protein LUQ31_01990 [Methanoregula sp.]|nr:hypothetical protein [Methanoregula sp.]